MGNVVNGDENIPIANGLNHGTGISLPGLLAVNINDHLNILTWNIEILQPLCCFIVVFTSREYSANDLNFVSLLSVVSSMRDQSLASVLYPAWCGGVA